MDWRLLVEDRIANIGIHLNFFFAVLMIFCLLNLFKGFGVFANQPTVPSGGVAGGESVAVAIGVSDR